MNVFMLLEALEKFELPDRFIRREQDNWHNVGARAWRTRLHCTVDGRVRSLRVSAWIERQRLRLEVRDENGVRVIGRPGHDPDIARRELEDETWVDPGSGLTWLRRPYEGPFIGLNPFLIIEDIRNHNGDGTFCDWRLPSLAELRTLLPGDRARCPTLVHPAIQPCLADRKRSFAVYGYRPGEDGSRPSGDADEDYRRVRVTGFSFPDGLLVPPPDDEITRFVRGCGPGIEPGKAQFEIHLLAVRG